MTLRTALLGACLTLVLAGAAAAAGDRRGPEAPSRLGLLGALFDCGGRFDAVLGLAAPDADEVAALLEGAEPRP